MFWENFIRLCNAKNIKPNNVAKLLGVPSGSVTDWKKGRKPRSTTLLKIADYFGVSVDYLLSDGADQSAAPSPMTDADLKFALFGGDKEIPDEVLEEVKRFAAYAKEKYGKQ
ncbi:MAG: helix-turn-helix transcriptional regulator [Clostridia bacterium]|nr:helix-turn-helix transcriptional regulator [Clostridia bacterium]